MAVDVYDVLLFHVVVVVVVVTVVVVTVAVVVDSLTGLLRVLSLSVENFIKHFKTYHVRLLLAVTVHSSHHSSLHITAWPLPRPVSVYDSIIFTANKRETAYHDQVLNGRQGKLQNVLG